MCVRSRAPASHSRSHSHEVSRSLEISRGQRAEIRLAIQITDSPLLITPGAGPRVLPARTPLTGSPVRTPAATTLPRRECAPRDLLLLERDGETQHTPPRDWRSTPTPVHVERGALEGLPFISLCVFSRTWSARYSAVAVPQAVPPPALSPAARRAGRARGMVVGPSVMCAIHTVPRYVCAKLDYLASSSDVVLYEGLARGRVEECWRPSRGVAAARRARCAHARAVAA